MKKVVIIGVLIVVLIIGASFVVRMQNSVDETENTTEYMEFSGNGVTLSAPGDWVSAESESNTTLLAVADPNSKDSSGFSNVNINIEKKNSSNSLDYEFKSNYNSLSRNSDYDILYEGNVTIFGTNGVEAGYTTNIDGVAKQHKAIWFKKDSDLYVILCTAPQSEFTTLEPTFDLIIKSIQIS